MIRVSPTILGQFSVRGFGKDVVADGRVATVAAPGADRVLDVLGNDASDLRAIGREQLAFGRLVVDRHQGGEVALELGFVEVAQAIVAENLRPAAVVDPGRGELAGLVGGNHEVAVADTGIARPARKRGRRIAPRGSVVIVEALKRLADRGELGLEVVQHPRGLLALQPFLVPVGDPGTDEHADDDDRDLERDREPVLRPQVCCKCRYP